VTPVCDGDVPYLTYDIEGAAPGATVTIRWINPDGDDVVQTGLPLSGRTLWPGAEVDDEGNPVDWPGWSFVDGEWVVGDEFDWVRPNVQVVVTVDGPVETLTLGTAGFSRLAEVGEPETIGYPPASPQCVADPDNGVLETSDPATPEITPSVAGEKFGALPQTGGSVLGAMGLSLALLLAGLALVAGAGRGRELTERSH
jgi:hypothetical protein